MSDSDDLIAKLIAAGFLSIVSFGIYRVLKSFDDHKQGDEIYIDNIVRSTNYQYRKYENRSDYKSNSFSHPYTGEPAAWAAHYRCSNCGRVYFFDKGEIIPKCENCGNDNFEDDD